MNNILKIIAHEGQAGAYTAFWWENESSFIMNDFFYESSFSYSSFYGFDTLDLDTYHYANFESGVEGYQQGYWYPNVNSDWEFDEYSLPGVGTTASCMWIPRTSGIKFILGSINNDGTIQGSSTYNIEDYPSGTNYNAGYQWYFTAASGQLSSHKIMPSIRWFTGLSFDASLEGTPQLSATSDRVSKDDFNYLPQITPAFLIQGNPLDFQLNEDAVNNLFDYTVVDITSRWLSSIYSYRSYNNYNGYCNASTDIWSIHGLGAMRLCYPIAAQVSTSNRHWKYVNDDFQHKWMGCDVTGNTFNPDLGGLSAGDINEILSYTLASNSNSAQDYYKIRDNYSYLSLNNISNYYNPATDDDYDVVYSGVYGKYWNKLYAPTIFSIECFTKEAEDNSLSFELDIAFPCNTFGIDNSVNKLFNSYVDGTWDSSAPYQGEFSSGAFSLEQIANTGTSGFTDSINFGVWHKYYEVSLPSSPDLQTTSLSISSNNNFRFKKIGDNNGKARMTAFVRLQNCATHRLYFKISKETVFSNEADHSFDVYLYDGLQVIQEQAMFKIQKDLYGSSAQNSANSNSLMINKGNDVYYDFNTPIAPKEALGNAEGRYRILVVGKSINTDVYFEFMKLSTNVTGVTEESKEFVAQKFTSPYNYIPSSFVSAINSNVPFKIETDLNKGKSIPDSSINSVNNVGSSNYVVYASSNQYQGVVSDDLNNSKWLTFKYPNVSIPTLPSIPLALTNAGVAGWDNTVLDGSLTFHGQQNGANQNADNAQIFGYESGDFGEDESNLLTGGVIDLSNVPFLYFNIYVSFYVTLSCPAGEEGFLHGENITLSLRDQNGDKIKNWIGLDIEYTTTINQYGPNSLFIDSSVNPQQGWSPVALNGTGQNGNVINANPITSIYLSISFPAAQGSDTHNHEIRIHKQGLASNLQFVPLMFDNAVNLWLPYTPDVGFLSDDFSNSGAGGSQYSRRKVRNIVPKSSLVSGSYLSVDEETSYSFIPLNVIPKDKWGYFNDETRTISGFIKRIGGKDISMFTDTLSYALNGWTRTNAEIRAIRFGTNENAFISRNTESGANGDFVKMYWNPGANYENITPAPIIKIHLPDFTETGGILADTFIGQTPNITITIYSYVPAGNSLMNDLIVWSGSNYHVIPDGTTGVYTITDLTLDDENIYLGIGSWSSGAFRQGGHGGEILFTSIGYHLNDATINVFTEPQQDGMGQGLTIKSSEPTVVPYSNDNFKYYIIAEHDLDVTNDGAPDYLSFVFAGTPSGNPVGTSTAYSSSEANSDIIVQWHTLTVVFQTVVYASTQAITDYVDWWLPSKDELTMAVAELSDSGELFDGYSYSANQGHWTSSAGTTDATKMWVVKVTTGQSTESAYNYSGGYKVRPVRTEITNEVYNVGDTAFGGVIWKKESTTNPAQVVKIIKTDDTAGVYTDAPTGDYNVWSYLLPQDMTEAQENIYAQIVSGATSESDGQGNTETLNTLFPNVTPISPINVASNHDDGTYDDWYIPSNNEWMQIYNSVGKGGSDVVDLFDETLSNQNDNVFYSSSLSVTSEGTLVFSLFKQVLALIDYGVTEWQGYITGGGYTGYPSYSNMKLRLARKVETNAAVSIGDTFQGGIVYAIEGSNTEIYKPSIERWFNTQTILSESGFGTSNWGELNSITFRVSIGSITSGNKVLVEHNLAQPSPITQFTPTGATPSYSFPYSNEYTTSGIMVVQITQPQGVFNETIHNGEWVGFKISVSNTDATQYLDVDIELVDISIERTYMLEDIVHNTKVETVINLYKEPDFSSTYSVKDFKHLSKVSSDYSKTLSIPATNINKSVFGSLSNIKGGNDISSAEGIPVSVYKSGNSIFKGLAFLNKTIYDDFETEESLELVLRGGNASAFSLLKDVMLSDIGVFNRLKPFNLEAAFSSSSFNDEILYPLIDTGKLDVDSNNVPVLTEQNLTPAYRLYYVFLNIFKHINYSVESNFLDLESEFQNLEFNEDFNGSDFKSFIGLSSYPTIPEKEINRSRIMMSFSGKTYKSRRYSQAATGQNIAGFNGTFVGNHDINNGYLTKTAVLKAHENRVYAIDYRPLTFQNAIPLAEGSQATVSLSSSLYQTNLTVGNISGSGVRGIGSVVNEIDMNSGKAPISWGGTIAAAEITVHRSGFYDVNALCNIDTYRDDFITVGNSGNIDPGSDVFTDGSPTEFAAGVSRRGRFGIVLIAFDEEGSNSNNCINEAVYNGVTSMGEHFFTDVNTTTETDTLISESNMFASSNNVQYLRQGVSYYPVAVLAQEISTTQYNEQNEHWLSNQNDVGEWIADSMLISGGTIDFNVRNSFAVKSCNLSVELNSNPVPLPAWQKIYNITYASPKIKLSDILPDISALEFVSEIAKIFNLVFTTNQKIRKIEVEPYADFYRHDIADKVVDWTDIAYVRSQKINTILPKTLDYKFVKDSSDKTVDYFEPTGDGAIKFGNVSLSLNPSSTENENISLSIFSAGKMTNSRGILVRNDNTETSSALSLITCYSSNNRPFYPDNASKPEALTSFNLKLAVTKGRFSSNAFKALNGISSSQFSEWDINKIKTLGGDLESLTDAVGYVDTAFTYSTRINCATCTFSNLSGYYTGGTDGELNPGLYNKYYQKQIETIKFSDRLILAEVKLTPADINNLNFRRVVKIKEDYYIISKILDYNPQNDNPTKVELVLVHQRGTKEKLL